MTGHEFTSVYKAEQHAINVYSNKTQGDRKASIFDLYDTLCKFEPYAQSMRESDMTKQEMYEIAERLRFHTGSGWLEYYYLPIMPFCRLKSLQYLLAHKQELLGNKGQDAFGEAFFRLERFFVTIIR